MRHITKMEKANRERRLRSAVEEAEAGASESIVFVLVASAFALAPCIGYLAFAWQSSP